MNKKSMSQDLLRKTDEAKLVSEQPVNVPVRSAEELLHELQVHQVEVEMQNESLRHAQVDLEESRDRYLDLYDFSLVGYLTLSREGTISEANLTGADLLGEDRHKLANRRFVNFVVTEDHDRWDQYFLQVLQLGKRQDCELSLKRGDGSRLDVHLDSLSLKLVVAEMRCASRSAASPSASG